ncbi:unnamed protein product [Musa acuminata var. zebrina]
MANSNLPRRIIKETQRLLSEPAPGISASPSEDNMRYFNVMILGPTQSPYEGGVFKLELFLPEEYPMAAPKSCPLLALGFISSCHMAGQQKLYYLYIGVSCSLQSLSVGASLIYLTNPSIIFSLSLKQVRFLTKIYHPNIDKARRQMDIQALLSAPNPDDPLSENIAKHWKTNEAEAVETAKEWTRLYASGA